MDFFLHYRNPNHHHHSSSSSSSFSSTVVTNNKSNNNSLFHGEKKKRNNNKIRNNKMSSKAVMKLSTDPQSVAARERRHRISERFKILRSMIPGGDTRNMDTVSMLEEAIQYVKLLKAQISFHQTMISFQNFGHHDHQHPHQEDHHPFDQMYGDNYQHLSSSLPQMGYEMIPQLGFDQEDSCFKVEGQDNNMVSLSHDHHHHHHVIYP